jgi:hypothetical protein
MIILGVYDLLFWWCLWGYSNSGVRLYACNRMLNDEINSHPNMFIIKLLNDHIFVTPQFADSILLKSDKNLILPGFLFSGNFEEANYGTTRRKYHF